MLNKKSLLMLYCATLLLVVPACHSDNDGHSKTMKYKSTKKQGKSHVVVNEPKEQKVAKVPAAKKPRAVKASAPKRRKKTVSTEQIMGEHPSVTATTVHRQQQLLFLKL